MAKYHITPKGEAGICHAESGGCPFGIAADHFPTLKEAQFHSEAHNEKQFGSFTTFSQPKFGEDLNSNVSDFPEAKTVPIYRKLASPKGSIKERMWEALDKVEDFISSGTDAQSFAKSAGVLILVVGTVTGGIMTANAVVTDSNPHSGTVISTHHTPEKSQVVLIGKIMNTVKTPQCYGVDIQASNGQTATWCVSQDVFNQTQIGQTFNAQQSDTVEGTIR